MRKQKKSKCSWAVVVLLLLMSLLTPFSLVPFVKVHAQADPASVLFKDNFSNYTDSGRETSIGVAGVDPTVPWRTATSTGDFIADGRQTSPVNDTLPWGPPHGTTSLWNGYNAAGGNGTSSGCNPSAEQCTYWINNPESPNSIMALSEDESVSATGVAQTGVCCSVELGDGDTYNKVAFSFNYYSTYSSTANITEQFFVWPSNGLWSGGPSGRETMIMDGPWGRIVYSWGSGQWQYGTESSWQNFPGSSTYRLPAQTWSNVTITVDLATSTFISILINGVAQLGSLSGVSTLESVMGHADWFIDGKGDRYTSVYSASECAISSQSSCTETGTSNAVYYFFGSILIEQLAAGTGPIVTPTSSSSTSKTLCTSPVTIDGVQWSYTTVSGGVYSGYPECGTGVSLGYTAFYLDTPGDAEGYFQNQFSVPTTSPTFTAWIWGQYDPVTVTITLITSGGSTTQLDSFTPNQVQIGQSQNPPRTYSLSSWAGQIVTIRIDQTSSGSTGTIAYYKDLTVASAPTLSMLSGFTGDDSGSVLLVIGDISLNPHGSKPSGVGYQVGMDSTPLGFVSAMMTNPQPPTFDTNPTYVDATGRPIGSYSLILSVGGAGVNAVTDYYETTSTMDRAPITWTQPNGVDTWTDRNGVVVYSVSHSSNAVPPGTSDVFTIQILRDSSGRLVVLMDGTTYTGTWAAAWYFKYVMYPHISSYQNGYYIIRWTDATTGTYADGIPDAGDSYMILAQGLS